MLLVLLLSNVGCFLATIYLFACSFSSLKVHGEPKETGERAIGLIALITNSYLKGGGGADWRFCLLLSSILVDITNKSVYKGITVSFVKARAKMNRRHRVFDRLSNFI